MDRALSYFGVYDVFGYLASGLSLVVGVWWIAAGEIPSLSVVAVLGLLGAGYLAGQPAAVLGNLWEKLLWKWHKGKPYVRMLELGDDGFSCALRGELVKRISVEAGVHDLDTKQRFTLARAKLRREGFDSRAETMRAMHGLCRNMAATSAALCLTALAFWIAEGREDERLWITAALALAGALVMAWRTARFERRFGREVWLNYLALRMTSADAR